MMTPEEHAITIRRALDDMNYYEGTLRRDAAIAGGIRRAVAEEREATIKIVQASFSGDGPSENESDMIEKIVTAIQRRGAI